MFVTSMAARHYDPYSAKFLSEDPIGLNGGDTNFYRYVNNRPLNNNDPNGNYSPTLLGLGWAGLGIWIVIDVTSDKSVIIETYKTIEKQCRLYAYKTQELVNEHRIKKGLSRIEYFSDPNSSVQSQKEPLQQPVQQPISSDPPRNSGLM